MKNKGITLIALVITIILLLILVGLSISALTGSGLFGKASEATNKYNQAKARETLELVLSEAQIRKYDEGLTEEQLDRKIEEIGELLPKEDENPNIQNVIVEGYIFKVDKSIPKIIDYVGPADGIIITAVLSTNEENGWVSKAQITGTIKTYSGGIITNVRVQKDDTEISEISIDAEGNYIIDNITDNGIYRIHAEDSNQKNATKEIPVEMNIDKTPPTISNAKATASLKKINISATATDNESGLKQISYSVTPTTISPKTGTLTSGQPITLTATETREYTITFTATDNSGNTVTKIVKVTTSNTISVATAKNQINASNLREYIGVQVDLNLKSLTWRVFYYDESGKYGRKKTTYLISDVDKSENVSLRSSDYGKPGNFAPGNYQRFNPFFYKNLNGSAQWGYSKMPITYSTNGLSSSYSGITNTVLSAPSLEMFVDSYCCAFNATNALKVTKKDNYGVNLVPDGVHTSGSTIQNSGLNIKGGLNNVFFGREQQVVFLYCLQCK